MATDTEIHDVSDTALWVAVYRARETERPDALFRDPLAALLAGKRGREIADSMPLPHVMQWVLTVRTVAIDGLIREAIADGVDTVVNIGAGLDTRPYRMELPAELRWVEVDLPHMVALKNEKLAAEKPRCRLERFPVDFSDRAATQKLYASIGAGARKALVITEGVIPYLTPTQAGELADDLLSVPSIAYWIQDYNDRKQGWRRPKVFDKRLKKAPFRFDSPDTLAFFGGHGWATKKKLLALEEGRRIGRPFPLKFPWKLLIMLMPRKKRQQLNEAFGYALLSRER